MHGSGLILGYSNSNVLTYHVCLREHVIWHQLQWLLTSSDFQQQFIHKWYFWRFRQYDNYLVSFLIDKFLRHFWLCYSLRFTSSISTDITKNSSIRTYQWYLVIYTRTYSCNSKHWNQYKLTLLKIPLLSFDFPLKAILACRKRKV